jgi:hypothetical protein
MSIDVEQSAKLHVQEAESRAHYDDEALTGQTSNGLSIIGSSPIQTVQCKK